MAPLSPNAFTMFHKEEYASSDLKYYYAHLEAAHVKAPHDSLPKRAEILDIYDTRLRGSG